MSRNLTPPIIYKPYEPLKQPVELPQDGTEERCPCGQDLFGIWKNGILHVKYREREMMIQGVVFIQCRSCGIGRTIDARNTRYTLVPKPMEIQGDEDEWFRNLLTVSKEIEATHAAIKLAGEHDIDLHQVNGTGKDGKITKGDVQSFIEGDLPE